MKQASTPRTVTALAALAFAGIASPVAAMTADLDAVMRFARDINARPIMPADIADAGSGPVAYTPQIKELTLPTTELTELAKLTLATDHAAAISAGARMGSPMPAGFTFGGSPVVSRAGHAEPHHRGPVAISVPLPHSAALALAGLVVVGGVRRRRLGTAEND